jgi:hypothetical protein
MVLSRLYYNCRAMDRVIGTSKTPTVETPDRVNALHFFFNTRSCPYPDRFVPHLCCSITVAKS